MCALRGPSAFVRSCEPRDFDRFRQLHSLWCCSWFYSMYRCGTELLAPNDAAKGKVSHRLNATENMRLQESNQQSSSETKVRKSKSWLY